MEYVDEFLKLVKENPELPIVPMVDGELVADDCYRWWMGSWGHSEVTEYYLGREKVHFRDDDEEDVLNDMIDCQYCKTKDGRDIYELSDDDWNKEYKNIPWTKAIIVYITT